MSSEPPGYLALSSREQINFLEYVIHWAIKAVSLPGTTAIDAGANIGAHTRTMAECVGPTGRVVAFEPDPRNRDPHLTLLQREQPWVTVSECALGARNGSANFHLASVGGCSSFYLRPHHNMVVAENISVEVIRLDDAPDVRSAQDVRFIKVDVEGAEIDVLRGAGATLKKHRPIAFTEVDRVILLDRTRKKRGPLGPVISRERAVRGFNRLVHGLGGGYVALNSFGQELTTYRPHDWSVALVPNDYDRQAFQSMLSAAGESFLRDHRDWSIY